MRQNGSFGMLVFVVIVGLGAGLALLVNSIAGNVPAVGIGVMAFVLASIASASIRVADQWDRAVILRLGKFHALKGPGLFFLIPVVDSIPYWIDIRVITTGFKAEKTLTKDTVPVDVDAVLFWKVVDPKKAALDVADYQSAIGWASQTALRDVIGKTMLSDMLEGRDKISSLLQKIIDERTEPWGITVISVEVKDVLIPSGLEDAMSMQAQAERERREVRGGRQALREQPGGVSFACHEHAVRGAEDEFHHRDRAQYGRGKHATWRTRGNDRANHGIGPETRKRHADPAQPNCRAIQRTSGTPA
jgi:regulator of protease activity HflC (stomatin/prohibitin superfamily)